jgi:hypothetical protein
VDGQKRDPRAGMDVTTNTPEFVSVNLRMYAVIALMLFNPPILRLVESQLNPECRCSLHLKPYAQYYNSHVNHVL